MPKKEMLAKHKGHKIRVVNTWFSGAKLYIDGDCRDTNNELLRVTPSTPTLSATIEIDEKKELVEIFMQAIVTVEIKICVNGEQIAGENF